VLLASAYLTLLLTAGKGGTTDETSSEIGIVSMAEPAAAMGREIVGNVPSSFRLMPRFASFFDTNADTETELIPFKSS